MYAKIKDHWSQLSLIRREHTTPKRSHLTQPTSPSTCRRTWCRHSLPRLERPGQVHWPRASTYKKMIKYKYYILFIDIYIYSFETCAMKHLRSPHTIDISSMMVPHFNAGSRAHAFRSSSISDQIACRASSQPQKQPSYTTIIFRLSCRIGNTYAHAHVHTHALRPNNGRTTPPPHHRRPGGTSPSNVNNRFYRFEDTRSRLANAKKEMREHALELEKQEAELQRGYNLLEEEQAILEGVFEGDYGKSSCSSLQSECRVQV